MNQHLAVESVGMEVLLVKDTKIVGEGFAHVLNGSTGTVSIEMRDANARQLVENSDQVKAWSNDFPEKKYKYSLFRFYAISGVYTGMDTGDTCCPELNDVRIVDKLKLRYGMVPDDFNNVEGYRAAFL